jgi:hypothetical protein
MPACCLCHSLQEWAFLSKMVFKLKPPERSSVPDQPLRRKAYYIATSLKFDYFITGKARHLRATSHVQACPFCVVCT